MAQEMACIFPFIFTILNLRKLFGAVFMKFENVHGKRVSFKFLG
jgi:hypothetical protein